MFDLDKDFILKWADALVSGEYEQAIGNLRFNDGFCCLGVACDLVDPGGWKDIKIGDNIHYRYDNCLLRLPLEIKDKIGLQSEIEDTLVEMNDSGESFEKISEYLKELVIQNQERSEL